MKSAAPRRMIPLLIGVAVALVVVLFLSDSPTLKRYGDDNMKRKEKQGGERRQVVDRLYEVIDGWTTSAGKNFSGRIVGWQVDRGNSSSSTKDMQSAEYEPLIGRWHRRVGSEGGGYLFFRHIRKAGGTSVRQYLDNVVNYHNALSKANGSGKVRMYEQEYGAMHWKCPELDEFRWAKTISVTVIRDPIERHLSEFFYSGVSSWKPLRSQRKRLLKLYKDRNFSREFYSIMEEFIPKWIADGMASLQSTGITHRHFSDEIHVRAFSGETGDLPYSKKPTNCTFNCDKWDLPCSYGGSNSELGDGHNGGTRASQMIDNVALARAKKVLNQFDLVLLTDSLSDLEQATFISDVLDVPLNVASTVQTKVRVGDEQGRRDLRLGLMSYAPRTYKLLQNHSQFEMNFFEYAQQLNRDLIKQWRNEKLELTDLTKTGL